VIDGWSDGHDPNAEAVLANVIGSIRILAP